MSVRLEAAKDYLFSVAERTLGINAYKRWQKHSLEHFEPTYEGYHNRKRTGITIAAPIQFLLPATTESIARSWSKSKFGTGEEENMNFFTHWGKYTSISMLDGISWVLLSNTHITEFVLAKLALNAATHVALDLGGEAVKRIKTFRPTGTTLVV